jgi:hypothetical protein
MYNQCVRSTRHWVLNAQAQRCILVHQSSAAQENLVFFPYSFLIKMGD